VHLKTEQCEKLKSLFQGIAQKPMSVQEKVVEFTMKEWIGDGRQLDDLMVIGIRPNEPRE
jgi:hypothetical protein